MHGGGSGQFAAIPLNFRSLSKASPPVADFAVSGAWSKKAAEEAKKYVTVNKVFEVDAFHRIPPASEWKINPDSAFLWYCANETIDGVEFQETPEVPEGVNLVADISSNILSRPIDVAKVSVISNSTTTVPFLKEFLSVPRSFLISQTVKERTRITSRDFSMQLSSRVPRRTSESAVLPSPSSEAISSAVKTSRLQEFSTTQRLPSMRACIILPVSLRKLQ